MGGLALARHQHRHGRIIGVDLAGAEPDLPNAADDGIEQTGSLSRPTRQCRAVKLETLGGHHLGLAIERQMMIELGDDHMGQRREGRLAARDGLGRRGGLNDLLAGPAAIFGADIAQHTPLHRRHVEQFIAVLAQRAQSPTAGWAGASATLGFDPTLRTGQMGWQGSNGRGTLRVSLDGLAGIGHLSLTLKLFQRQFQLLDLVCKPLRRLAKRHPPQLCQLEA